MGSIMHINDFNSLIQLAATLSIAFVVVEYAKSYTGIIARNIFKFQDKLQKAIDKCLSHIDKDTINGLKEAILDGRSIKGEIERVKRESEKLSRELENSKKELDKTIMKKCESQSFSFISLYLFFFSLAALFIAGIKESDYIYKLWFIFSVISGVFIIFSWCFGEKTKGNYTLIYNSLKKCVYFFVCILAFSCIVAFLPWLWFIDVAKYSWSVVIIFTTLLPYMNFVIFAFMIKKKSTHINHEIDSKINSLEARCVALENDVKELATIKNVSLKICGDEDTESNIGSEDHGDNNTNHQYRNPKFYTKNNKRDKFRK